MTLLLSQCNEPLYGSFIDVKTTVTYFDWIERLYDSEITEGCEQCPFRKFCPESKILRSEMAEFVVRARGETQLLGQPDYFNDVPDTYPRYGWIQRLAADGFAEECAAGMFCPDDEMLRGPMAKLLTLAIGDPPTHSGPQAYPDVGPSHPYYDWIQHLAENALTIACSPSTTLFCPDQAAPRDQVAWYIGNAFGLPAPPPTPDVHHFVQAGAAPPGDGSPSAPYPSIQTAFTAAIQSGKRAAVSIAGGTYSENLKSRCATGDTTCDTNPYPILVEGCQSSSRIDGTIVQAPGGSGYPLRFVNAHGMTFRFMTFQDGAGAGVSIEQGTTGILLEDVLIRNNSVTGILMDQSTATVKNSEIRDQTENGNNERGEGILERNSSTLSVSGTLVQANRTAGIEVNASAATIENSQILDTQMSSRNAAGQPSFVFPQLPAGTGMGIFATNGSTVTVTGNTVSGNVYTGVLLSTSEATITGNTVQDNGSGDLTNPYAVAFPTMPVGDYNSGGVYSQDGCPVGGGQCEQIIIQNNTFARNTGAHVLLESSSASVLSNQMSDAQALPNGLFGHGIRVQSNMDNVRALWLLFQGNTIDIARDAGIRLTYNDATIRDNTINGVVANPPYWEPSDPASGSGIYVTFLSNATLDSSGGGGNRMEQNGAYGLYCAGNSTVAASLITSGQNAKSGVVLQDCTNMSLDQSLVEQSTGSGIDMQNSTATVTRSTIRTTFADQGTPGFGIWVKSSSNLVLGGSPGMGNAVSTNSRGGVVLYSSTSGTISYNTIDSVQTGSWSDYDALGDGLFANGTVAGGASNNTIQGNYKYGAHLLGVDGGFTLGSNTYSGNGKGDVLIVPLGGMPLI